MKLYIICTAVIVAAFIGIYFSGRIFIEDDNYFHLNINSGEILFETDEKFLSVALDISFMRCFFHIFNDSDWKILEEFGKLLSPAYLRVGGTDADLTFFSINSVSDKQFVGNNSCEDFSSKDKLIISGEDWIKLNTFAQKSGLNLIIDLNVLFRTNSKWNSSNAEALIKFSEENGFPLDFQLGNEPNSFPHTFNITLTGKQLAEDFNELRKLLNSTKAYKRSKLIGPDVTRPKNLESPSLKFLSEFLSRKGVVDVVSWHQYYLNGRTATLEDFINPDTFDLLQPQINAISKVVRQYSATTPIWIKRLESCLLVMKEDVGGTSFIEIWKRFIGETSTAYGGGAPKLSNRFVASFLWLDKLGTAARSNISVVVRQSLFKDRYALITDYLIPSPDFWISVLFKQLVGPRVLFVKLENEYESKLVRFYAHCLAYNSSLNGSIVIYGMNLRNQTQMFVPSGISIVYPVYSYIFRPELNNLKAKTILLNNQELIYDQISVHDMLQKAEEVEFPLILPSYAIGFWVLKEKTETACGK